MAGGDSPTIKSNFCSISVCVRLYLVSTNTSSMRRSDIIDHRLLKQVHAQISGWKDTFDPALLSSKNSTWSPLLPSPANTNIVLECKGKELVGSWSIRRDRTTTLVSLRGQNCAKTLLKNPPPRGQRVVLAGPFNENWGALSSEVINRTAPWGNMPSHLLPYTVDQLRQLLDSPEVVFWLVNSHQFEPHAKVLSLPIGGPRAGVWLSGEKALHLGGNRNRLLLIAGSIYRFRSSIYELVNRSFDGSIESMHVSGLDFTHALLQSKYVLCPGGLGWDTRRHWQTLLAGGIPVMESQPGFDRTFAGLPVLIVRHFRELTPLLLESLYPWFTAQKWDFKRLTTRYWTDLVAQTVQNSSHTAALASHPLHVHTPKRFKMQGVATIRMTIR